MAYGAALWKDWSAARLRPANPLATQVHFLARAFKALLVLIVIAALGWGVWRVASRGVGVA